MNESKKEKTRDRKKECVFCVCERERVREREKSTTKCMHQQANHMSVLLMHGIRTDMRVCARAHTHK